MFMPVSSSKTIVFTLLLIIKISDGFFLKAPPIKTLQRKRKQERGAVILNVSDGGIESSNEPPTPKQTHSFVEGSNYYENELEEVEAMGGDPFFLMDDPTEVRGKNDKQLKMSTFDTEPKEREEIYKWKPTDGKGPMPKPPSKFSEMDEWDGTIDEEAHLGLD